MRCRVRPLLPDRHDALAIPLNRYTTSPDTRPSGWAGWRSARASAIRFVGASSERRYQDGLANSLKFTRLDAYAMKFITIAVCLAALLTCIPIKAQTPEQWTKWGTLVHGGFGSLIAYGIRVGDDALKRLNAQKREVIVDYVDNPAAPCACVADGIAIAVTASLGQRSLRLSDNNAPSHLLARVIFTHKETKQTAIYELPWTALAQMREINSRLPPEQRYAAVMKLDTDKLYSVMQPR